jgi:hypothetical protein
MNDEMERIRKEAVMTLSTYYPNIFLKELKKTTNNLKQDSQCPGRDSKGASPRALPLSQPLNVVL